MPLLILDITCETWKIIILNFGFMVLTGNWPQTKALIIWGLTREQDTRGREASGRQQAVGGRWKQDYMTTTGTRGGGWEHTRVGSRSLTAPRSACSLRAYIGSISGVVDVQSFWFWILSNDHLQQFTNNYKEGGCFYYFVAKLSLKGTHLNVKKNPTKTLKTLPTAQGA